MNVWMTEYIVLHVIFFKLKAEGLMDFYAGFLEGLMSKV